MNNSGAPIGENGKKELKIKITQSEEVDKLIDNFFKDLEKEEYKLNVRTLIFDVPEVSIKSKVSEENEKSNPLSAINVLESGKRDFVLEEIARGAGLNIKLAELRKVKAKTAKIKQEKAEKKSTSKDEKTENRERE